MTTSAPSIASAQGPSVRPSHSTMRRSRVPRRLRTTTSSPRARNARLRTAPTWPLTPGITIFMNSIHLTGYLNRRVCRMIDRDTFDVMALPNSMRAVVTGAGSGLGRAFCLELGRRGARIVASDIDLGSAEKTADACGGQAVRCDVSRLADVETLGNDVDRLLGGV